MIAAGWFFVLLGVIGAVLPVMPTTVFLIIALALFSQSSQRFHQMLLDNRWFGEDLKRWERQKCIARSTKIKASIMIVLSFAASIYLFRHLLWLIAVMICLAALLLIIIWRLKEGES